MNNYYDEDDYNDELWDEEISTEIKRLEQS